MFRDRRLLLRQRRRRRDRTPFDRRFRPLEKPRVPDDSASQRDAVDAAFPHSPNDRRLVEEVAASENRKIGTITLNRDIFFNFVQKVPIRDAGITLQHRPSVYRDAVDADVEQAVEQAEKRFAALRRIVEAAPQFRRYRNVRRNRLPHPSRDLDRPLRLRHKESAATLPDDLPHRASEVQVDQVESEFEQLQRRRDEFVRRRAHQLRAGRLVGVAGR